MKRVSIDLFLTAADQAEETRILLDTLFEEI